MLVILSPSKTLDLESPWKDVPLTQPELLNDAAPLIETLRGYSPVRLSRLMGISPKLAALNAERNRQFATPFTEANARPALLTFKGDVYTPMRAEHYTAKDLAYAQAHIRILSGLYGVLRPLDLMQAYRLEMGTRLRVKKTRDLYQFWGDRITAQLNQTLAGHKEKVVVNLASEEYFKAVRPEKLEGDVVHVEFRDTPKSGGKAKIVGIYAKKARGMMADYVIRHRVAKAPLLAHFNERGYAHHPELSTPQRMIFIR